jgi:catechol 2,3-dioxygenase-like lactoylglutathione lyase family enzyme
MSMQRLIHVNVVCSDLERSEDFYTRLLGGEVVSRAEKTDSPFMRSQGYAGANAYRAAFIGFPKPAGGPVIDLLEWSDGPDEVRSPPDAKDIGIPRIAIGVEGVDALHSRLVAEGCDVLGEPTDLDVGGRRIRAFFTRDPDGVLLELAESRRG